LSGHVEDKAIVKVLDLGLLETAKAEKRFLLGLREVKKAPSVRCFKQTLTTSTNNGGAAARRPLIS
jgi:hypothetical protein